MSKIATLKIRKAGNSLGIILPQEIIDRLFLHEDDLVQMIEEHEEESQGVPSPRPAFTRAVIGPGGMVYYQ